MSERTPENNLFCADCGGCWEARWGVSYSMGMDFYLLPENINVDASRIKSEWEASGLKGICVTSHTVCFLRLGFFLP